MHIKNHNMCICLRQRPAARRLHLGGLQRVHVDDLYHISFIITILYYFIRLYNNNDIIIIDIIIIIMIIVRIII